MRHPPKAANEVFVFNTEGSEVPSRFASLSTMRSGLPAYDLDGNSIPGMCALFIDNSESDELNDIMMTRTFGPDWKTHSRH